MIARFLLSIALLLSATTTAYGCKPLSWGRGADTTAQYAWNLMKHADAIFLGRVVTAEFVEHSQHSASSTAQVYVIEQFKGPDGIREIRSEGWGTCPARRYTTGEERLFVLLQSNDGRLQEVLAWQHPKFPDSELLSEFRKLKQPNTAFEADAVQRRALHGAAQRER